LNRDDVRRAVVDLRVAVDDADALAEDMLRSPRRRELGPVLHRKQYTEARRKVTAASSYLMRLVADGPTDPSSSGSADPTH
jgi:hypothetical protein